MQMANAINYLSDGEAAKRASWGGYVAKTVTSESGAATTTYTLTFKNRAGTEYVYTWDGSAWTAPETTLPVDADMIEAMLADDWVTGKTTAFETARSGSGTW